MKQLTLKRFLPLAIIGIVLCSFYFLGIFDLLSIETLQGHRNHLQQFVKSYPLLSPFLFMFIYIFAVMISFPGSSFLSIIGGFLFVQPWSSLYVITAATIGACGIFLLAKHALYDVFSQKAGPFLHKLQKGFTKNQTSYLPFLRFVPVFPFWLINIAPAFFHVPLFTYAWTTALGIIPGVYIYTQIGSGLGSILDADEPFSLSSMVNLEIRLAFIAIGLMCLLPTFFKKKNG